MTKDGQQDPGRLFAVNRYAVSRNRVLAWLDEFRDETPNRSIAVGPITDENFQDLLLFDKPTQYIRALRAVHVAVDAEPAGHDNSHRFWEHFASGSVLVTDGMLGLVPQPMLPNEHYFAYDIRDGAASNFHALLRWIFEHEEEARNVARRGWLNAVKHHRSVNRADYLFRTLATLRGSSHTYTETGQELTTRAKARSVENWEKAYTNWARTRISNAAHLRYYTLKAFGMKVPEMAQQQRESLDDYLTGKGRRNKAR
jgi:hypothetical protein